MNAKKLSPPQYAMIEELRKIGKVKMTDGNRKTYKKLIDYGLVDYDSRYTSVVLTEAGKLIEL